MRYAIFLKEINLSIFSFFSYMRNLNNVYLKSNGVSEGVRDYFGVVGMIMTMEKHMNPSFQSTTPCQN